VRVANKLKFFRLAFGAAGGFGDEVDTREARVAIEGLFGGDGRIQLGWMVDDPTMSKSGLKVLLNLVLIAGDALVRGGRLDVGAERHDAGLDIVVRAEGPRIVLDPELKRPLLGREQRGGHCPARGGGVARPLPRQRRRRRDPGRRSRAERPSRRGRSAHAVNASLTPCSDNRSGESEGHGRAHIRIHCRSARDDRSARI
jgi:hypothetical protein